jgi:hypothetical protein
MPLNVSQLITLALQDARKNTSFATGGGFAIQAGQFLQMILDDLCYKYDLKININPALIPLTGSPTPYAGAQPGVGPYPLPSDYLRMAQDEVVYSASGAPRKMVNDDLSSIDLAGLLPLTASFPELFATDFSTSPPSLFVWPPPSSVVNLNIRYFRLQPAIDTTPASVVVPWFQDQMYLKSRLTAELLKPQPEAKAFLEEASVLLGQYLKLEDDSEGRAIIMKLDERNFRRGSRMGLPKTKGFDL